MKFTVKYRVPSFPRISKSFAFYAWIEICSRQVLLRCFIIDLSEYVTTSLFLLKGEVPPEIEHLINLEDLNLSRNLLTGELPHELGQLANLKTLILFGNKFILPNGITNKAEGHLHILSDATKVKFLMKKLFQASDKDSGSSAILAAARARRLAAEESD